MPARLLSEWDRDWDKASEALEMRMQSAAGGRLRSLHVAYVAGRFKVIATCPSYHVRQLAEQAALGHLSADQLELYVHVLPPPKMHEPA
jgi:hypothetical protein